MQRNLIIRFRRCRYTFRFFGVVFYLAIYDLVVDLAADLAAFSGQLIVHDNLGGCLPAYVDRMHGPVSKKSSRNR